MLSSLCLPCVPVVAYDSPETAVTEQVPFTLHRVCWVSRSIPLGSQTFTQEFARAEVSENCPINDIFQNIFITFFPAILNHHYAMLIYVSKKINHVTFFFRLTLCTCGRIRLSINSSHWASSIQASQSVLSFMQHSTGFTDFHSRVCTCRGEWKLSY